MHDAASKIEAAARQPRDLAEAKPAERGQMNKTAYPEMRRIHAVIGPHLRDPEQVTYLLHREGTDRVRPDSLHLGAIVPEGRVLRNSALLRIQLHCRDAVKHGPRSRRMKRFQQLSVP